jgi:hypothetical protein
MWKQELTNLLLKELVVVVVERPTCVHGDWRPHFIGPALNQGGYESMDRPLMKIGEDGLLWVSRFEVVDDGSGVLDPDVVVGLHNGNNTDTCLRKKNLAREQLNNKQLICVAKILHIASRL